MGALKAEACRNDVEPAKEAYSQTACRPVKSLVRAHQRMVVNNPQGVDDFSDPLERPSLEWRRLPGDDRWLRRGHFALLPIRRANPQR